MNVKELIQNSGLPPKESELLASFILKEDRVHLIAHPETKVSFWQARRFKRQAKRFRNGWSLAALSGHKGFYGLDFLVNKHVLIPRPETELLVETAIKEAEIKNPSDIFDIGCGSGVIIISLAHLLKDKDITFQASDISHPALAVARRNARRLEAKEIIFKQGDLFSPFRKKDFSGKNLLICANLPYLTSEQVAASPSIKREPRLALISGTDGLDHYRRLFGQLASLPSPFQTFTILAEIDPSQSERISQEVKNIWPTAAVSIKKDLAGQDRLAIIKL
jgi:release factor glutamine methyltransferase